MQNVEIKARLRDRAALERRLVELGARPAWSRRMRDTFFPVASGWLKLREQDGAPAELIAYARASDVTGPRASDYEIAPVADATALARVLGRALGRDVVVAKERALWTWKQTRVHVDRVDGLGEFLELETVVREIDFETAKAECDELIARLGLRSEDFLAVPYRDLLERRE